MRKVYTNEEVATFLDSVREDIIQEGRWSLGNWVERFGYDPDETKPPIMLDPCEWKFCLGGAIVWKTLTHKTPKGRAAAWEKAGEYGYDQYLRLNSLAARSCNAIAGSIRNTKWYTEQAKDSPFSYDGDVGLIIQWNDVDSRKRGDVTRLLRRTSERLRKNASATNS